MIYIFHKKENFWVFFFTFQLGCECNFFPTHHISYNGSNFPFLCLCKNNHETNEWVLGNSDSEKILKKPPDITTYQQHFMKLHWKWTEKKRNAFSILPANSAFVTMVSILWNLKEAFSFKLNRQVRKIITEKQRTNITSSSKNMHLAQKYFPMQTPQLTQFCWTWLNTSQQF